MRNGNIFILGVIAAAIAFSTQAFAQTTQPADGGKDYSNSLIVTRMMRFDVRKDGKLTRDEITDDRLKRLFDQADANKDGVVTRQELIAVAAKLDAQVADDSDRPDGGPGMDDGRPDGPGGPGGPGGFRGPPRPGQILPPGLQQALGLTDDQKAELAKLQKEVDNRLATILTDDQRQQLQNMSMHRPGGPPDGGPGDGPPPDN